MTQKTDEARPITSPTSKGSDRVKEPLTAGGKTFGICPVCLGALRYGSHDRVEGVYYYWCTECGCGPISFTDPLPISQTVKYNACNHCGRLVCSARGPGVVRCADFKSHAFMQRVERDTPSNEAKIRGLSG